MLGIHQGGVSGVIAEKPSVETVSVFQDTAPVHIEGVV